MCLLVYVRICASLRVGLRRIGAVCICQVLTGFSLITADPGLENIDRVLVKRCHAAATTCILEMVKQNADKSTIRY